MTKALFVVSADLFDGPFNDVREPLKDYVAVARQLGADVLDRTCVGKVPLACSVADTLGVATAQAWLAAASSSRYDVILTDGEHIGIPLALLLQRMDARVPLVTIGHRLSTGKKRPFFRIARVQNRISRAIVHSSRQRDLAIERLGFRPDQVVLLPYQVDARFWRPVSSPDERLIVSAGLEYRDYPTLFAAVAGLNAHVVIGAASRWSRRQNTALGPARPPNVQVGSFDYCGLRALYARAAIVVVPLDDVDFQAGVTTILEAMAMGKAVIATQTAGQTDVVSDRRAAMARAQPPMGRTSLLGELAASAGVPIEPNGLYVPPKDPRVLRRAISYLLDHPDECARLGAAGRRLVERLLTVEQFAERVAHVVEEAALHGGASSGRSEAGSRPACAPATR
jgi:glycosyltransferase involved in cell wall biosynthesis